MHITYENLEVEEGIICLSAISATSPADSLENLFMERTTAVTSLQLKFQSCSLSPEDRSTCKVKRNSSVLENNDDTVFLVFKELFYYIVHSHNKYI